MKLIKLWHILLLFFILSVYLFSRFSIVYFTDKSGENSTIGNLSNFFISTYYSKLNGKYLDRVFYYNPQYLFPMKSDLILQFSGNDIKHNDSVVDLIKSSKINWVTDELKKWREANVIYNNKNIKVKYKFHGSSLDQYVNGIQSYSIRSSEKIFDRRELKLGATIDFTYRNIFLNQMAEKFDLIHEDLGEIIVVKDHEKVKDYYLYENFDDKYVEKTYNLSNPIVLRNLTFNEGYVIDAHSSQLDNVSYNIDTDRLSKDVFLKWDNLQRLDLDKIKIDNDYIARFFSLVYLFGNPHHITGNNDKWVISNEGLFPVYRNEDTFSKLTDADRYSPEEFNNYIFQNYYYSKTHDKYKKLLQEEEIINLRNKYFKKIVDMREEILIDFDSIFFSNKNLHKRFNENYFLMKNSHNKYKRLISHNIDIIDDYINSGYIIAMLKDDYLFLKSSRNNKLEILFNDYRVPFFSKSFFVDNKGNLKDSLNEFKKPLDKTIDIRDIKLIDLVTNDTIDYESNKIHFINIQ